MYLISACSSASFGLAHDENPMRVSNGYDLDKLISLSCNHVDSGMMLSIRITCGSMYSVLVDLVLASIRLAILHA